MYCACVEWYSSLLTLIRAVCYSDLSTAWQISQFGDSGIHTLYLHNYSCMTCSEPLHSLPEHLEYWLSWVTLTYHATRAVLLWHFSKWDFFAGLCTVISNSCGGLSLLKLQLSSTMAESFYVHIDQDENWWRIFLRKEKLHMYSTVLS